MFYSSSRSASGTTTIMDLSNVHHESTAEIGMQASDSKLLVGRLLASLPSAAQAPGGGSGGNGLSQQQTSSGANVPPADDSKMSGAAKSSKPNASSGAAASSSKVVRYRECMKNHAASIGGHALDGCGEFMPSGEEGTIEALKCAACDCHRNFHKREVEGEPLICDICHMNRRERNRKAAAIAAGVPQNNVNSPPAGGGGGGGGGVTPSPLPLSQQKGGGGGGMNLLALTTRDGSDVDQLGGGMMSPMSMKKRFRTKFSMDQKERMYMFAEKLGWRIQKHDEAAVQQFCAEVGVKRHVLKVWMHNNKHTFGKRSSSLMTSSPSALLGTSVNPAAGGGDSGPSSTTTPPPPPPLLNPVSQQ